MNSRLLLILLVVIPIATITHHSGPFVSAKEDAADVLEGEEEGNVEEEPSPTDALSGSPASDGDGSEQEDGSSLKSHPDADTHFLITKPVGMGLDLPAGKDVSFLVGFANRGKQDMLVESLEASFRYAMDFSFHLQNFSAVAYNKLVRPKEEATLAYSFFVSEAYSTRPYGFTVNLYYKDAEGNQYVTPVFNETVSIVELDEGLDGETFFLYVFLAALVILLAVLFQQYFLSRGRKRSSAKTVELGTVANGRDVDYDWLPEDTLRKINNKSPKATKSPKSTRKPKEA